MIQMGLKPLEEYTKSFAKWKCQCMESSCGRIQYKRYKDVKKSQRGCNHKDYVQHKGPRRYVSCDEAVEIMLRNNYKPLEPYPGKVSARWKCECLNAGCGKEVYPTCRNANERGNGCRYCLRLKVDENTAVAKMLSYGLNPLEPYRNARTLWKCLCLNKDCGRIVYAKYGGVSSGHRGCWYCTGIKTDPKEAENIMLSCGFRPLEPYSGRNRNRWKCECLKCGEIVFPSYANVKTSGTKCSACCKRGGFDTRKPGVFYVLMDYIKFDEGSRRKKWEGLAIQYGISTKIHKRLYNHSLTGFTSPPFLLIYDDGSVIAQLERKIKETLNNMNVPSCAKHGEYGFDGSTESFSPENLEMESFLNLVLDTYNGIAT